MGGATLCEPLAAVSPPKRGCHGAMGKDDATVAKSSTLPFEGGGNTVSRGVAGGVVHIYPPCSLE